MKNLAWITTIAALGLSLGACGDSTGSGGSGTGGEGGETTTTSTSTVTSSTATTSTGQVTCDTADLDPACGTCVEANCCAQFGACLDSANCDACLLGGGTDCDNDATLGTLITCLEASCQTECFGDPPVEIDPSCDAPTTSPSAGACFAGQPCNPVTNAGCDTNAGEACDYGANGFECYPAPNTVMLCGDCPGGGGADFCVGGQTCVNTAMGGKCAKFCCDNADCGTGTCDLMAGGGTVGVCVAP